MLFYALWGCLDDVFIDCIASFKGRNFRVKFPSQEFYPYLCLYRKTSRPDCDMSWHTSARAAAAPWATAVAQCGWWLCRGALEFRPWFTVLLGPGLKWAAKARTSLMIDFRFPSTISEGQNKSRGPKAGTELRTHSFNTYLLMMQVRKAFKVSILTKPCLTGKQDLKAITIKYNNVLW